MDRRQFLKRASAAIAAGMVLDPERLLWVPGAKTIFLPDTTLVEAKTIDDAIRMGLVARIRNDYGWGGVWTELTLNVSAAQLPKEIAAIEAMGGHIVERRTYQKVDL